MRNISFKYSLECETNFKENIDDVNIFDLDENHFSREDEIPAILFIIIN